MIRKLLRYFMYTKLSDRLPPLPREYSTDFDRRDVSLDAARLMAVSRIRSPSGARRLMRRYRAKSLHELAMTIPVPKRQRRDRLMPLLRRMAGTTPYNPMKRYMPPRDRRRIVYVPKARR